MFNKFKSKDTAIQTRISRKPWFSFAKKANKRKEKFNWKLFFHNFPSKMIKEISRIRWIKKQPLLKKFLIVIVFAIVFALFYAGLDQVLLNIFKLIHAI